jgi:hypothetical protein
MTNTKPNCFFVNCFGKISGGLPVSQDQKGQHVAAGGYIFRPNYVVPCIMSKAESGNSVVVQNANIETVKTGSGVKVHTLTLPSPDKVLVKIDFVNKRSGNLKVNGRELYLHAGVSKALVANQGEALVELTQGEEVVVFYDNGQVRSFYLFGNELSERVLMAEEMMFLRIQSAWDRLNRAFHTHTLDESFVRGVLSGMADLIHLTTLPAYKAGGQELRMQLLQNFFLQLPEKDLSLVHAKLIAVLHQVDSALVQMLYGNVSFELEDRRKAKAAGGKSAAKREVDRQLRAAMKGSNQGSGNSSKSKPKKAARK